MAARSEKVTFQGSHGLSLAARLDLPEGRARASVLFAHCFTCSKDIRAASRIASELVMKGFAVFRFDFTGLGMSEGEFANTNFSSNVQDLHAAMAYLRERGMPAQVLVGHSLGGTAVLAAAGDAPDVKAVATIGAPSDAAHVAHNFQAHLDEIREKGEASVVLAGRTFTIRKQFLDDIESTRLGERIAKLHKPLLIFHSPIDETVGIDNASAIFLAAKHPKSFVSLDKADHLLSRPADGAYVAEVLSAWASRYIMEEAVEAKDDTMPAEGAVIVTETGSGKYQQAIIAAGHHLLADEPIAKGGTATGPSPYDLVAAGLGACTAITLRVYADFKKLALGRIQVVVKHDKRHMDDCLDCVKDKAGKADHFERVIRVQGVNDTALQEKLLDIANRCPVHRTLEGGAKIETRVEDAVSE
jgi:putative redox protein